MNQPPAPPNEPDGNPQSEERIQRILRQSQREAGTRDVLTFALGKAWSVLLILGAAFVVAADRFAKGDNEASD